MKKRLLSTLLILCMTLALLPITAQAADVNYRVIGGNIYFDVIKGTITSCDETVTEAVIPSKIYGFPVTTIEAQAFGSCRNLISVSIPDSVTTIGYKAFGQCVSLTSVTIHNGVTRIDSDAFNGCVSLTSVTIPSSVASIEDNTFYGCASLTDVTILNGASRIGAYAFSECASLTSVAIPESVRSIGKSAFSGCTSLTDVYFSGSIEQWATIVASTDSNNPLLSANLHFNSTMPSTPVAPSIPATGVVLSPQKLTVDGKNVDCERYNINGSNYFKLRDLAHALNRTGSQFEVGFDAATSTVSITTGEAYTPIGTELTVGVDNSKTARSSSQTILINGAPYGELTVYNIGGSNFFQLRQLGSILGFEVGFDAAANTAIVRSIRK